MYLLHSLFIVLSLKEYNLCTHINDSNIFVLKQLYFGRHFVIDVHNK